MAKSNYVQTLEHAKDLSIGYRVSSKALETVGLPQFER